MNKFLQNKTWLMFFVGLVLGMLIFFPTNQIKEKIFARVLQTSGAQLQAESMSLGTGLGLGLNKGGAFALTFKKLRIQKGDAIIDCDEATLSPHFLNFFVGQMAIGVDCHSTKNGTVSAKAVLKPFWSPETMSIDSTFKGLNLVAFGQTLEAYPIRGILYGDLQVRDMSLITRVGLPSMGWKLSMQKVALPAINSDFISLPEIALGTLDTTGSMQNGKLQTSPLILGSGDSPLKMNLDINLTLTSQLIPTAGEIKGSMTADPAWEASIKNTLDLALLFGTPDEKGSRRFRKPIQGGPFSLLSPPLPY